MQAAGTTNYCYAADGTKLAVRDASGNGFAYLGSLILSPSSTEFQFSDGVIRKTTSGYEVNYFLRDHLGSVRTVVNAAGEVVQQSDYYPFGSKQENATYVNNSNRFLYNSKELQTTGGLGFLDYGARMYDAKLGRFFTQDRFSEKYTNLSQYQYAGNNPIINVEINGDSIFVSNTGRILRNTEQDNLVYCNDTYLGELGGKIDANFIFGNLLKENAEIAKKIWNPFTFKRLVQNKGEWDYKNNEKYLYGYANKNGHRTKFLFKNMEMTVQDMGNFNYGASGKAAGFGDHFLLFMAGYVQKKAGTSKLEWQQYQFQTFSNIGGTFSLPTQMSPYGDDPEDQYWIKKGFYNE